MQAIRTVLIASVSLSGCTTINNAKVAADSRERSQLFVSASGQSIWSRARIAAFAGPDQQWHEVGQYAEVRVSPGFAVLFENGVRVMVSKEDCRIDGEVVPRTVRHVLVYEDGTVLYDALPAETTLDGSYVRPSIEEPQSDLGELKLRVTGDPSR